MNTRLIHEEFNILKCYRKKITLMTPNIHKSLLQAKGEQCPPVKQSKMDGKQVGTEIAKAGARRGTYPHFFNN